METYRLTAPRQNYVTSPDGSIRTIRVMTQAQYDSTAPHDDDTEFIVIIPSVP